MTEGVPADPDTDAAVVGKSVLLPTAGKGAGDAAICGEASGSAVLAPSRINGGGALDRSKDFVSDLRAKTICWPLFSRLWKSRE